MVIEADEIKDGKRKLVAREHCLQEQQIAIKINKVGDDYEVSVNGKRVDKRLTMLWLFEETAPNSEKFAQSFEKVLPSESFNDSSTLDTFWGRHKIDKPTVTGALKVCHRTYDEKDSAREEINEDTWCIMQPDQDTLYVGFRGTDDTCDWLSNLNAALECSNELNSKNGWSDEVKFHQGFDIRSRTMLLGSKIIDKIDGLVREHNIKRIVTCGHSLGGALAQILHIQLHGELRVPGREDPIRFDMPGERELINITFATPMVGNHYLRDNLGDIAKQMYHFVEAEDIVPALLFSHHLYQKLALSDWQLRTILWAAGCKSKLQERANTLKECISDLKTKEQSAENTYAPIGHYLLIDADKLYELPNDDTSYVAQALIPALNVLKDITIKYQVWKYVEKGATLGFCDNTATTKILSHHKLKNYHEKLAALGFTD